MIRNYFKIAWRNLLRNRMYSVINIFGLALGMAVVILIGMWVVDELSFNKAFKNYDRIVRVMHNYRNSVNGDLETVPVMSVPVVPELRENYGSLFEHIALVKNWSHIVANGDKKIGTHGLTAEPELADILSLDVVKGSSQALSDPTSILISETVAQNLFGNTDPIGKSIRLDNKTTVSVGGVYRDFGRNTDFWKTDFIQSWTYLENEQAWVKEARDHWDNNSFILYATLSPTVGLSQASQRVKNLFDGKPDPGGKESVFLHPMAKWHLYNEFKNGVNTGGAIQFVWMFGGIGIFVLLLACINFMNLSTARSQKRAKEVGVRKSVGSVRSQLVIQFMSESILVVVLSLVLTLLLVQLALPFFNQLADKELRFPWGNPQFWLGLLGFTFLTGLLAGSYPSFYLSSLNPVAVLKGTFRAGRFAALPRKVLVVVQFTVSVSLIIGTIVILQQIKHVQNRPIGYDRNGLITIPMSTPDLYGKYDLLRNELINSGGAINMAEASNAATEITNISTGFDWAGKDPRMDPEFGVSDISHDYAKTVGWKFKSGRDFSRAFATDSSGMILNEAAAHLIGFKDPLGATVRLGDASYHVIGIIQNPIMESPFTPVRPTLFLLNYENVSMITVKANPSLSMGQALARIEPVFKKYNPGAPFTYRFVDDDYAQKFSSEVRVGNLAAVFAILAVFISCLGIFGLASFMAEQRIKEIGVRKVLGANVFSLWRLLSADFVTLVAISFLIAIPLAWYIMEGWLHRYAYRTSIDAWVILAAAAGTLIITLGTVSFQAIKAATTNPVKSLRSE